ncbi:enoyl-CoA hydratase/isomerase family protein [Cryptosporangium aurantiacum]|uniref:Enoyl-CoA hydratase/carnithine racemase n=1 Tax=Cryptosporangium aurantiacum TaxID=134849 RepID=A0A1M7PHV2_9ACTN|nr:enoyl-CoA hydratase-related protein [Cryptosporangium aurantiacum]SHN16637.1 Enoyl-CoA hydratase/carnithine racemase [Cryptosporangium aurantiacum]
MSDAATESGLREQRRGHVVEFTIDRPARRNALTVALVSALADRLLAAGAQGVRAAVIAGGPPVFCAGGDLVDLGAVADEGPIAVNEVVYTQFHRLVSALSTVPYPVIAAIDGAALGAGLDLALCCDLRVATGRSTFASSWIGVGLVPGMGGAHLLTRSIGSSRAHELVLLGHTIDAVTASDWGLVNRVVEPDALPGAVAEVTDRVVSLPATAVARSKASLRRAAQAGLTEELATLGAVQGTLLTGPDFRERTARFR